MGFSTLIGPDTRIQIFANFCSMFVWALSRTVSRYDRRISNLVYRAFASTIRKLPACAGPRTSLDIFANFCIYFKEVDTLASDHSVLIALPRNAKYAIDDHDVCLRTCVQNVQNMYVAQKLPIVPCKLALEKETEVLMCPHQ